MRKKSINYGLKSAAAVFKIMLLIASNFVNSKIAVLYYGIEGETRPE